MFRGALWLLTARVMAAAGQEADYLLPGIRKPTATICMTPRKPMIDCEPNTTVYGRFNTLGGYESALLWEVTGLMGWGKHWERVSTRCLPRRDFNALLANGTADGCDLLVGGINVTPALRRAGWVFTVPTFHDGLQIAVAPKVVMPSAWGFMYSFSWQVWVALVLTCFATAVVVWVIDGATGSVCDGNDSLMSKSFDTVGRVVGLRDRGRHPASGLVLVFFSFLVMIAMILYGSNITANLTAVYVQQPITSHTDLRHKRVLTAPEYVRKLRRLGIANVSAFRRRIETDEDIDAMLEQVRSRAVDAVVLDASKLHFKTAANCHLDVVGLPFYLFDRAFALPPGTACNSSLLEAMDSILLELWNSGAMEMLADSPLGNNVRRPPNDCRAEKLAENDHVIYFRSVTALWLLWAGSVCLAFVWMLLDLHVWRKPWCQARVAALRGRMLRLGRRLRPSRRTADGDGSQAAGDAAASPRGSSKELGTPDSDVKLSLGVGSSALSRQLEMLGSSAVGVRVHRRGSHIHPMVTSEAV